MLQPPLHLVWFKRDLRIADHAPLAAAIACASIDGGKVLCVYAFEPRIVQAPDYAAQHFEFARECLIELKSSLRTCGADLHVFFGEMIEVLDAVHAIHPITTIASHEETGNALTFARDLDVIAWAGTHGVTFVEHPQFGVVRRLRSRNGWAARWEKFMRMPNIAAPERIPAAQFSVPQGFQRRAFCFPEADLVQRQRGGRAIGLALLDSFLTTRGQDYRRGMSSPLSAPQVCSRISPYLAMGAISLREVVHALHAAQANSALLPSGFAASLRSFEGRLHWHCHFIQKLESEPAIEFHAFLRALDQLRANGDNAQWRSAWETGHTGYPMIDACMRMLRATGWLNFRMRAMIVSFAAYNLWLDWRTIAHFLARHFLDYEPGIHYSQLQMQSGVTGINALRIYNPTKQAQDHDPDGAFIKQWCPELSQIPAAQIFEPWALTAMEQMQYGVRIDIDYPAPIVDWVSSYRAAKTQFTLARGAIDTRAQAAGVMEKHGSRKSGMRITGEQKTKKKRDITAIPAAQISLF